MRTAKSSFTLSVLVSLVLACNSGGSDAQDPAAACAGKPVPPHACIGSVREPRCTTLPSGEARWQIDCIRQDPTKPADTTGGAPVGISFCEAKACGPMPAWDESDCVHGFFGAEPNCSSVDRGECAWGRFCKPKPCTADDPSCNVLHPERVGASCEGTYRCSSGYSCVRLVVNLGEDAGYVCVREPVCDALTCAAGRSCTETLSDPGTVSCSR